MMRLQERIKVLFKQRDKILNQIKKEKNMGKVIKKMLLKERKVIFIM